MEITKRWIDAIGKPAFVFRENGNAVYINTHGYLMAQKALLKDEIKTIYELDPDFNCKEDFAKTQKAIFFSRLKVSAEIFKASFDAIQPVYILIFDNILFNEDVSNIVNSIGYVVNIINQDAASEAFSEIGYDVIGLSREETGVGHSLLEHYENKSTCVTEPTGLVALREKKAVIGRTTYKTGVTLLHKANPIFSKEGELKRVVVTGQDVSDNAAIDEMLILSENNSIPTAIRLNEIDQYFSNENYSIASDVMKKIVNKAIRAARSDSSIFIWGESGVGKEMIAKIIHYSSMRKDKPFVTINCAAIPSELMESELFGYEQGAFTGASKGGKKGLLEEANGGTVFLDELGELPYPMQSKLLRAIQENSIRRVGGTGTISIDVRYVSATNLKMDQILDNNVFREDLYYRLSVIPINIPPLRKRREDIIPLIRQYLKYYNDQQGRRVSFSKKAYKELIAYDWPGNIRELKNTIERNVLLAEEDVIAEVDLGNEFSPAVKKAAENGKAQEQPADEAGDILVRNTITMSEAYDEVFNCLVKRVYKESGSIVKTAQILAINPSTIHRRIKDGKLVL